MTTASHYTLPDLGYDFDALEPAYSAELLELHYTRHHRAYVDGANRALAGLNEARKDARFDRLSGLQQDLAYHLSGHMLHGIFWRSMAPSRDAGPPDALGLAVSASFGSFDAMREQFLAAGVALHGSGWASLSWEPLGHRLVVEQIHDHQGNKSAATVPILVMDMWEHAYYLQYRNEKQRWTKAFWDLINWREVGALFDRARSLRLETPAGEPRKRVA